MKLLLTSGGIKNASIRDALLDLLGKPIGDASALCIPTAEYGHPMCTPASAWRFGRLIDHVHLRVSDLGASKRFYRAVFAALGKADVFVEAEDHFSADELWVDVADGAVSRVHLAFQASDRAMVEAFHAAALAAGGRDNGGPGERSYHPGYYAAFVLDPDGNNIEAVFHGSATRSAESVVITPTGP